MAARSAESIQWCVQRQIPIAQVYQTTDQIEDTFNYDRQLSQQAGREASAEQFILTRHIYVDETDDKARAAAEPALRYFFSLWNRGFNDAASHAGAAQPRIRAALNTEHSFAYFREGNCERVNFHPMSWADLDKTGFIIAGSPDSVARKLKQQMRQVGAEYFMGMFHIGNLAHDKVISSLNLFHREVMPRL